MIKVENILMDVFSDIAPVTGHNKLLFHFGEQKELNNVIQTRQENEQYTYPLLWYLMPNELTGYNGYVEGDMRFILAHNTELQWFNDQRFEKVFNEILQPNFDLVVKAIRKSSRMDFVGEERFRYTNYPNYGNPTTFEGKDEAKQINYWDAIGFTINLRAYGLNEC